MRRSSMFFVPKAPQGELSSLQVEVFEGVQVGVLHKRPAEDEAANFLQRTPVGGQIKVLVTLQNPE